MSNEMIVAATNNQQTAIMKTGFQLLSTSLKLILFRNSFPHKYDDDPRGQDNGAPRQYYGSRRQNDSSRRQKDVPRRPEGSVSRDEYKDDSYGYGGIRRNDNRSRNEAVNPPQRNYDDGQRRHEVCSILSFVIHV